MLPSSDGSEAASPGRPHQHQHQHQRQSAPLSAFPSAISTPVRVLTSAAHSNNGCIQGEAIAVPVPSVAAADSHALKLPATLQRSSSTSPSGGKTTGQFDGSHPDTAARSFALVHVKPTRQFDGSHAETVARSSSSVQLSRQPLHQQQGQPQQQQQPQPQQSSHQAYRTLPAPFSAMLASTRSAGAPAAGSSGSGAVVRPRLTFGRSSIVPGSLPAV